MRRPLLAHLFALALLVAAAPLSAYVIVLKDGSTLQAREKYRVQGNTALITLPSGAQTTLPLAQIDVAKTEASNASDFGSATVLAVPVVTPTPTKPTAPSLAELAAQRRPPPPAPTPRPTPTPPRVPTSATGAEGDKGLARTPAGFVDFMRAPRTPVTQVQLATTVAELMRSHGIQSVGVYEGTQRRRLLVEVTANSEGAVFQAVAATAQSVLDLEAKQPGAVEGLELFLATDRRSRAGQFFITVERARELATKRLDLTGFYLKYVEF